MRRRGLLPALAASAAVAQTAVQRKGRLKQSVTRGVIARSMSFEETSRVAAEMGCRGYDLIGPGEWPVLKKYGLIPTMYPPGPGGTIADGLNRNGIGNRLDSPNNFGVYTQTLTNPRVMQVALRVEF
jgi:hydroxypyruvate isomerase